MIVAQFNVTRKQKKTGIGAHQQNLEPMDHDYCGVPTRGVEYRSRLGIQNFKIFSRIVTVPTSIQANMPSSGYPIYRLICIKSFTSTSPIYFMELRSIQKRLGCIPNKFESNLFMQSSPHTIPSTPLDLI